MCELWFQTGNLMNNHINKFHKENGKLIDKSKYSRHSSKCGICQTYFPSYQIIDHFKSCHIYSKHIRKTSKGFQCLICLQEIDSFVRGTIFEHIETKHPNYASQSKTIEGNTDNTNLTADNEKNEGKNKEISLFKLSIHDGKNLTTPAVINPIISKTENASKINPEKIISEVVKEIKKENDSEDTVDHDMVMVPIISSDHEEKTITSPIITNPTKNHLQQYHQTQANRKRPKYIRGSPNKKAVTISI